MQRTTLLILLIIVLGGCTSNDLKAPCPEYGKWCRKIPVNTWDYRHSETQQA